MLKRILTGIVLSPLRKVALMLRTMVYLLPRQIYSQVIWRLKVRLGLNGIYGKDKTLSFSGPLEFKVFSPAIASEFDLEIMKERLGPSQGILWNPPGDSLLKQYHLHYFNYLFTTGNKRKQYQCSKEMEWILDWIKHNPPGSGVGWHPYPLSLRLGNWIVFYLEYKDTFKRLVHENDVFLESLKTQASFLLKNFEYHLMGNHLLENARALYMAAVLFNHTQWAKKAGFMLIQQLDEQILPDGGHYEKSLLYQNIIFKHLMDTYSVLSASPVSDAFPFFQEVKQKLKDVLPNMWHFYCDMGGNLSEPPLWGDTALNMMYGFSVLKQYYHLLFGEQTNSESTCCLKRESGYAIYKDSRHFLIMDVGTLGPDYQPGHAHCDLLGFTYHFNSHPILVDSGLGNYESGKVRAYVRSTKAHNTVVVNDLPQAECWQAFRMARRVKPETAVFSEEEGRFNVQSGYMHAWAPKNKKYTHRRNIKYNKEDFWEIHDRIEARQSATFSCYFHFHPNVKVTLRKHMYEITCEDEALYFLWSDLSLKVTETTGMYIQNYDLPRENKILQFHGHFVTLKKMSYVITPASSLEVAKQYLYKESPHEE